MAIDALEFEKMCKEFISTKGVGFSIRTVRDIAKTASEHYAKGAKLSDAMYQALDQHGVTKTWERSLYCQVMGRYFGKHGQEAKAEKKVEELKSGRRGKKWVDMSRQGQLKFR